MHALTALIIEDEAAIRRFVRSALEDEGYRVFEADTVARGLIEAGTRKPDVLVLDLGLPDGDGVSLLLDLRSWSKVPVIVLSARVDEVDKIAALDAGADDYLTKPFGVGELQARVRALQRRRSGDGSESNGSLVRLGEAVTVDLANRSVSRDGEPVHLTQLEYRLLATLLPLLCIAGSLNTILDHSGVPKQMVASLSESITSPWLMMLGNNGLLRRVILQGNLLNGI